MNCLTVYGESLPETPKKIAGRSAAESGYAFEKSIMEYFSEKKRKYNMGLERHPPWKDFYGLNKQGDFMLHFADGKRWHIEAKQLGNMESHYEKLAFVEKCLSEGCYGDRFMLIYDHEITSARANRMMKAIESHWEELRNQLMELGIKFVFVRYRDLNKCLRFL